MPVVFHRGQHARRAEKRSHVQVVPAGVHHAHLVAGVVLHANLAGVRQACVFRHRQRVHVGAHQDHWPGAVLHERHDAVAARAVRIFTDVFGYVVAGFPQLGGEKRRSTLFVMRKLGVLVKIDVGGDEARKLLFDARGDRRIGG